MLWDPINAMVLNALGVAYYFGRGTEEDLSLIHIFSDENATDVMCDFFQLAKIPDVQNWTCEELKPAPRKVESTLTVDGEDFRYFQEQP